MDVPLQVYEPENQNIALIAVALAVFVIGTIGAVWLFRQDLNSRGSQYNGLLGMLMGFIALIALGTGVFEWLSTTKTGTVKIYSNRIELGKHQIAFQNLDNAMIQESKVTSWINPNITKRATLLLFIADRSGNTYVLSEENYPIKKILENLRKATAQWEAAPTH